MTSMSITAIVAVSVLLTGCATCERHPIGCAAAVGFVATSIALSVNQSAGSGGGLSGSPAKLIRQLPMAHPTETTKIPQTPMGPTTY